MLLLNLQKMMFMFNFVGDWQIDYITGGPFEVYITDKADIKVYSMQDGTVCSYPHLIGNSCLVF